MNHSLARIAIAARTLSGHYAIFTGVMHIAAPFAPLAIRAEFLGGLGVLFGLRTRIAVFGIVRDTLVAIPMVQRKERIRFGMGAEGPSCPSD